MSWSTTRNIVVPGVGFVGTDASVTTWQLSNLHGDVTATQPNTAGVATLASNTETDEYGVAVSGTPGRYGYLGVHQRSDDALGGLTLMGVRLYNPGTGTFLSNDPVLGGGATRYGYPFDPVNGHDVSGRDWREWVFNRAWDAVGIAFDYGCSAFGLGTFLCRAVAGMLLGGVRYVMWDVWTKSRSFSSYTLIIKMAYGALNGVLGHGFSLYWKKYYLKRMGVYSRYMATYIGRRLSARIFGNMDSWLFYLAGFIDDATRYALDRVY